MRVTLPTKVGTMPGDVITFAKMPEVGKRVRVFGCEGKYEFPGRKGIKMFVWVDDIIRKPDGSIFLVMVHPHFWC